MPFPPRGKLQGSDAKAHRVPKVQSGKFFQHQLGEMDLIRRGDAGRHPGIHGGLGRSLVVFNDGGYRVELFFLSLPTADIAVERVAQRVRQGGHDIPEATIRHRFDAVKRLFVEVYQPLVDQWILYDNAGDEPQLISWSDKP